MIVLSNMVTPRIEREAESRNYGMYTISPLERGYGSTLGNALRRVLLSSLEGAAITSIRITDVQHEFSDIPGIREDVIQIMLQLKQIRMKLVDVDTARLHLEVRGEGVVTAADIIAPPEVEIVNPDLYLFTSDSTTDQAGNRNDRRAWARLFSRPTTAAAVCRSVNCRLMPSLPPSSRSTGKSVRPALVRAPTTTN